VRSGNCLLNSVVAMVAMVAVVAVVAVAVMVAVMAACPRDKLFDLENQWSCNPRAPPLLTLSGVVGRGCQHRPQSWSFSTATTGNC